MTIWQGVPAEHHETLRRVALQWNDDISGHRDHIIKIYGPLAAAGDKTGITVHADLAYGDHPRQVLDVFQGPGAGPLAPVMVFVHGGAFTRGSKSMDGEIYDNVLYWFTRHGCVGVNIEYRNAPESQYPGGARDVAAAVAWVEANIAAYGGDPARIILAGHSAGGTHLGTYLLDPVIDMPASPSIRGAVLLSARLRADVLPENPNAKPVEAYFGTTDPAALNDRSPTTYAARARIPVFVAIGGAENRLLDIYGAEFFTELLKAGRRDARFLQLPHHTHTSMVAHFNTGEDILGLAILGFMAELCGCAL